MFFTPSPATDSCLTRAGGAQVHEWRWAAWRRGVEVGECVGFGSAAGRIWGQMNAVTCKGARNGARVRFYNALHANFAVMVVSLRARVCTAYGGRARVKTSQTDLILLAFFSRHKEI